MNVYRPKFKDRKSGELRETPRWYIDFRTHKGTRQRFAGDIDKDVTIETARMLEDLVRCRKRKVTPKDRVWNWIRRSSPNLQERLVKLDLVDKDWLPTTCQADPLSEWVDEFETWFSTSKSKNGYQRNRIYVAVAMTRIRNIVSGCRFKRWSDITPAKVDTYLGSLPITTGTHNGYIVAIKHFAKWCRKNGKVSDNPLADLAKLRQSERETRRPLDVPEIRPLLAGRFCMSWALLPGFAAMSCRG